MALMENTHATPSVFEGLRSSDKIGSYHRLQHRSTGWQCAAFFSRQDGTPRNGSLAPDSVPAHLECQWDFLFFFQFYFLSTAGDQIFC